MIHQTKTELLERLSKHQVFKGHSCLELLKRATTEDQLELALDAVWAQAEARNLALLA